MSYRLTFLPQVKALTQRRTALTSAAALFVLSIAVGVGCTSGDRTLGVESSGSAASLAVAVASVTVSPASVTLAPGATRQFSVILRDAAGNRLSLSGRTVTWKSSNKLVATVSSTGLVKALVLGSAVITATVEGKSGTSKVTVKNILSWIWSNGFETSLGGMNVTAGTHVGGSVTRVKALPHKGLYSLKFKTPSRTKAGQQPSSLSPVFLRTFTSPMCGSESLRANHRTFSWK